MRKIFHSNNNKFLIVYETAYQKPKNIKPKNIKNLIKDDFFNKTSNEIDGIIWVDNVKDGFIYFDLFNIDGGRAEVSGNGLACLSLFLYNTIKIKNFNFVNSFYRNKIFYSKVVNHNSVAVGFDLQDAIIKNKIYKNFHIYELNIPNPHLVLPASNFDEKEALELASDIFQFFQGKYNVHVFDYEKMFMYTFERGVGFTYSCGSGTIACCYLYVNVIKKSKDLSISLNIASKGGKIRVSVENEIYWLYTNPKEC